MRGQIASQLLSLCSNLAELKGTGMLGAISDGVANFRLCRLAEAWQRRDPPRFTGRLQIRDRADFQLLVERLDFFAPRPGMENSSRMAEGNSARNSSRNLSSAGASPVH